MNIVFHRHFGKEYKKQSKKIQEAFKIRLVLFHLDEFDPRLNNHPLRGAYQGYRSINVSGDIRAVYTRKDAETIVFTNIGSHSQLYT